MMTSASIVALCALAPTLAAAQDSLAGAPGQALASGAVTTGGGSIWDQGPGAGVQVSAGANDTVTADGAVIDSDQTNGNGLLVSSAASGPGLLTVNVTGGDIDAPGSAVTIFSAGEAVALNVTGANLTGDTGLSARSSGADVSIVSTDNFIDVSRTGVFGGADGAGGNLTIQSTGGAIISASYGIAGQGQMSGAGGDVTIGTGAGVTTAITTGTNGVGVMATTSGAGDITVRTGAGGTINGGGSAILANNLGGSGAIDIDVGATIGGATAPTSTAVQAVAGGGSVNVDATAFITGMAGGVYAATTGGTGDVTVSTRQVVSLNGTAINAQISGGSGDISYTLNGGNAVQGVTGAFLRTTGSGDVTVTAADPTSSFIGTSFAGLDTRAAAGGNISIDIAGARGGTDAIYASNSGAGTISIDASGLVQGARAITATTTGTGAIDIGATERLGMVLSSAGSGIYASGGGDISVHTSTVTANGGRAVEVQGSGGNLLIDAGGTISGSTTGLYAYNNGGPGSVTVLTGADVHGTSATGLVAQTLGFGAVSVGTADQRLGGVVTGGTTGIFSAGAGDVSVYASQVSGGTRGIVAASQLAPSGSGSNGSVLVDVTGTVVGQSSFGIVGVNFGTLSTNTLTIHAADVFSTGGSAISAQTTGGDIEIVAGSVRANAAANGTWDGIYAEGEQDTNISIRANGTVTGSYRGVDAIANGASTRGAISVTAIGAVQGQTGVNASSTGVGGIDLDLGAVTGTSGAGVFASSAGDVSVTTTGAVTSNGGAPATLTNFIVSGATAQSGFGVVGLSTGGSVTLGLGGQVTGGAAGGVLAQTGAGDIDITTAGVSAATGRGIEADSSGGDITIDAGGAVYGATNAIYASNSGAGTITVTTGSTVNSGTGYGIEVRQSGSGAVSVGTAEDRLGGAVTSGSTGIFAASMGDVSVYAGQVTGGTRGIVAASQATGSNGSVVVDVTGPVVGQSSFGVIGVNFGTLATNVIGIHTGGTVTSTGGSAISAQTVGGDISITADGAIRANAGNGQFWDGIYAEGDFDTNISITANADVTGSWAGIEALANGATSRGAISIDASGVVSGLRGVKAASTGVGGVDLNLATVIGTNGAGVFASSAGDVSVSTGAVTSTGGTAATLTNNVVTGATELNGFGVVALSSGGSVDVTTGGPVTGGAAGGILAQTGTGDIDIVTAGVTAGVGKAIEADSAGGDISIDLGGAISGASYGVHATNSGAGSITVTSASTIQGGSATGVVANTTGFGAVSVGTADDRLGGAVTGGTTGIFAAGAGDVSVYAGQVTGGTRGIVASSQLPPTGAGSNGSVVVDVTGPVVGQSSFGIVGVNNGALASNILSIHTGGTVTSTGGSAISAQTVGGDISITADGVVTSNIGLNGSTWDGIYAEGDYDTNIDITANAAVTGSWSGIEAFANHATTRGAISIEAAGLVTGQHGVVATSTGVGGIDLDLASVTGTNGAGVFASGAGDVSLSTTGAVSSTGGTAATLTNNVVSGATAANGFAVAGLSTGGSMSIDLGGPVTGGAAGGVLAITGTGDIDVTTAAVTAAVGRAIEADALGGDISIHAGGAIDGALNGIYATNSGAGTITVLADSTVRGGTSNGIVAQTYGFGAVSVGTAEDRLGGAVTAGTTGIFAAGAGDVSVYAASVTGGTRGIVAASQLSPGGPGSNGSVTVDVTGPVVGQNSFGVIGVNFGTLATNIIDIHAGAVTSTGGSAISAQSVGGDISIVTDGVITANAGPNGTWDGIYAEGDRDTNISITANQAVTGSFRGIDAIANGASTRGAISIEASGLVTGQRGVSAVSTGVGGIDLTLAAVTGTNGEGVYARGAGDVALALNGAIHGSTHGVVAESTGAGDVTVDLAGAVTAPGTGVAASTASGDISITTTAAGTIAAGADVGIDARSTSGAITIDQAGAMGAAGAGNTVDTGIWAEIGTGDADLTIDSSGAIYVTAGEGLQSAGIYAVHGGTGAISVSTSGLIDPGAYGVVLQGGGAVSFAATGGLVEGGLGVHANSTGAGPLSVTLADGSTVKGLSGAGVTAIGHGGAVDLDLDGEIDGATAGVVVANSGAGAITLTNAGTILGATDGVSLSTGGTGSLSVISSGMVTGQLGTGISAVGGSGGTSVTVDAQVQGGQTGVYASSTGAGATTVSVNAAVFGASTSGMTVVSGTGGLHVDVNANVVSTGGAAINATSAAGGVINIAEGAVVAGLVDSAGEGVINLNTASGASSTINVAEGAVVRTVEGSSFDVAIRATGGSVQVNNFGTISGRVDFSALTGANTGRLVSGEGTAFVTSGTSVFGGGDDDFVNSGDLIAVGAVTTFDFRGGNNTFTNNGTIFVGFPPPGSSMGKSRRAAAPFGALAAAPAATGSTLILTGLTTWANTGTLEMGNGVVGDAIIAVGSNFVGTGASKLSIDVDLASGDFASDRLVIGTSTGHTLVQVHDASGGYGALDVDGTIVVAGSTHPGDFVLDPTSSWYDADLFGGALAKPGLFFSRLSVDARGTVLASAPKTEAFQFAALGAQAQTVWYASSARSEHGAELRDRLVGADSASGVAFWAAADASTAEREVGQRFGGYAYDAGYAQSTETLSLGVDVLRPSADGGFAFGASLGWVGSDADFDQGRTGTRLDGLTASAWAGWLAGDAFVSATAGVDSLDAELSAPELAGWTRQETGVTTLGAALEAGLRKPFLFGATVEPTASLAWVRSDMDEVSAAGATFRYDAADSVRAGLGARVSGDLAGGEWSKRYAFAVRAVGELSGENETTVLNAGDDLVVTDAFDRAFGEVRASVSGEHGGWNAFGDARVRFNDRYTDTGVTVGLRLRY